MAKRQEKRTGQAVIEFVLLMPLFMLIIANVVNYGGMFYAAITVANAARHGSQHFIYGSATVKNAPTPGVDSVWLLVQNDTATLPNLASRVIRVCLENRNRECGELWRHVLRGDYGGQRSAARLADGSATVPGVDSVWLLVNDTATSCDSSLSRKPERCDLA